MSADFILAPRIEAQTAAFTRLQLCCVRIMNDARFPWILLIPARPGLREIHELEPGLSAVLMEEITLASHALQAATGALKMNVAALGNIEPQLHVHVVARREDDSAWPGPVWGFGGATLYSPAEMAEFAARLRNSFQRVSRRKTDIVAGFDKV